MAEVEFIAGVEEAAGPGYARVVCAEVEGSSSLSSACREAQQPYSQKRSESVLFCAAYGKYVHLGK